MPSWSPAPPPASLRGWHPHVTMGTVALLSSSNRAAPDRPREVTKDGRIGGQAVLEGVMMRGISTWAVAVRKPSEEQLAAGGADSKEGSQGRDRGWSRSR